MHKHPGQNKVESIMETKKSFDPSSKGPIKKRSCTDIVCCILYLICVLGMIGISLVGFIHGNPRRLTYPTDSEGNLCGYKDFLKKPYLMFFDLLQCGKMSNQVKSGGCLTPQVCVANCTSSSYVYVQTIGLELKAGHMLTEERKKMLCKYNVNPINKSLSVQTLVMNKDCAAYYVKTTPVVGRCIPSVFLEISSMSTALTTDKNIPIQQADGSNVTASELDSAISYLARFYGFFRFGNAVYNDLVTCWYILIIGLGLTMALSMTWIILMRWIAGIMVWMTFLFLGVFLFYGTYYAFAQYIELRDTNFTANFETPESFSDKNHSVRDSWLALGCIGIIFLLLFLLFLFCTCSKIKMATLILKEGSRAVGYMFCVLFWPLFPFALELAFCAYWITSFVFIASIGKAEFSKPSNITSDSSSTADHIRSKVMSQLNRIPCGPDLQSQLKLQCEFVKYGHTEYKSYFQAYLIFMLIWMMNFINALGQTVLAGAFASYYWAFKKPNDIPAFPVTHSLFRTIRYHLGSLAFGSLIITIIQVIRMVLNYIDNSLKDSKNVAARFILGCLRCCFYCFEKFMKFFNENAYVMIAVHGKNFCLSGKDAFFLITRNIVRTVVMDSTVYLILFVCKFFITVIVFGITLGWFRGDIPVWESHVPVLNNYLIPVIISTLVGFMVACAFLGVYSMALRTIYLCFLEDLEVNDGSPEKPFFMSKHLLELMGKDKKN